MTYTPLPHSFFDWWFTPWRYAERVSFQTPFAVDMLGQRDAYRAWCEQAHIPAELPADFDPAWHAVIAASGAPLAAAGRLFAGLLAARRHDMTTLGTLALDERRWCTGVAATQPVRSCLEESGMDGEIAEVCGLAELAARLQHGFPGMWHRLRLTLPEELAARVDKLMMAQQMPESAAAVARTQRCWVLCQNRALTAPLV